MNILFVGDSNFRDLFSYHKKRIESGTRTSISFEQVTSVISTKNILENLEKDPDIIMVAAPTNEISAKSRNNTKSREGIIETVVSDLFNVINDCAAKKDKCLFVVTQPFLRVEPPWIETKLVYYREQMKKSYNNSSQGNVQLGSEIEINLDDLKQDKIHLNKDGIEKVADLLLADVRIAVSECKRIRSGESNSERETDVEMDAEDIPLSQSGRKLRNTPARKKRPLEDSEDEVKTKKKRGKEEKIDSVLEKLDLLFAKMDDDRSTTRERFEKVEERLEQTSTEQENLKEEIKQLKKGENSFVASMREDLDAIENLNSRDTVVLKKVKIDKDVPTDKKELTDLIIEKGKEIVSNLMGSTQGIRYVAPLYFKLENRGQGYQAAKRVPPKKELPPIKINFKQLTEAMEFKDKVIVASKDPGNALHKVYVTNIQNVGTRIRSNILWSIAESLKKEKKESWVSQSSPKPALLVKSGNLVKNYSYMEAVTNFEEKIDKKVKDDVTKLAQRFYYGQVEKIFIVLKD
jgi:hypothetical protein